MLRQLANLTRRVPAAGPRALAIAVYSDAKGETFRARETGDEGVACVDDAARAFQLLVQLWLATGNPSLRDWAEGLLEFVCWMYDGDGRWVNFIYDWEGARNERGPTSSPGSNFWQARAAHALSTAALELNAGEAREPLADALAYAMRTSAPADVRSLHACTALALLRAEPQAPLEAALNAWCDELVDCRIGDTLMNSPDERGKPHLWGHIQEAVLIDAAVSLNRPDLRGIAERSAAAVFRDVIESGFDLPHVQPYDVQSAVFVMDRLSAGTGGDRYERLGGMARDWFRGRNPAGAPVYLPELGRVCDGIDNGVVNAHSGAEANISAGLALTDDPGARGSGGPGLG